MGASGMRLLGWARRVAVCSAARHARPGRACMQASVPANQRICFTSNLHPSLQFRNTSAPLRAASPTHQNTRRGTRASRSRQHCLLRRRLRRCLLDAEAPSAMLAAAYAVRARIADSSTHRRLMELCALLSSEPLRSSASRLAACRPARVCAAAAAAVCAGGSFARRAAAGEQGARPRERRCDGPDAEGADEPGERVLLARATRTVSSPT